MQDIYLGFWIKLNSYQHFLASSTKTQTYYLTCQPATMITFLWLISDFLFLFLISVSVPLTWLVDINKYLPRTQMGWFLTPQVWMIVWPLIEAQTITVCEPLAECCNLQTLEMFLFFFLKSFTLFFVLVSVILSRGNHLRWHSCPASSRQGVSSPENSYWLL